MGHKIEKIGIGVNAEKEKDAKFSWVRCAARSLHGPGAAIIIRSVAATFH
jgi:hypothetical protein